MTLKLLGVFKYFGSAINNMWCDICAWPSGTCLVFHVAVATLKRATHRLTVLTSNVWSL